MYCSKCGKENSNESKFCIHCGASLVASESTVSTDVATPVVDTAAPSVATPEVAPAETAAPTEEAAPKKKKKALKWILIVVGILFALFLVAALTSESVEDMLAEGRYSEAYAKSTDLNQKDLILSEDRAGQVILEVESILEEIDSYKSFVVDGAYVYFFTRDDGTFGTQVVLKTTVTLNSGTSGEFNFVYTRTTDNEWYYWGVISDYGSDETKESTSYMLAEIVYDSCLEKGFRIDSTAVARLNEFKDTGKLTSIVSIDDSDVDTTNFEEG